MIVALVQFKLPEQLSREEVRARFAQVAAMFREPQGLIRKCFIISEDGATGGGVYLWETREAAERFYHGGALEQIAQHYNTPTVSYFKAPVVVDNLTGQLLGDAVAA